MQNPYETLGVPKDATAAQIKAAYRKLAQQHHPDRDGGDKALFQAVSAAYELLSDPEKRAHYDQTGSVPGQPPSDMEMAMKTVCMAIEQAMQGIDPEFTDPLKAAAGNIRDAVNAVKGQIKQLEGQKKKVEVAMKRLKAKTGKEDRCTMVFQMLLDKIAGPLAHLTQQKPVLELALQILSDHEYQVDNKAPGRPNQSEGLEYLMNMARQQRFGSSAPWNDFKW